jgi:hypothetical protein
MNKILLSVLGTSAVVFALLCAGCATQPRDEGQIGTISVDKPVYTGTIMKMQVTVKDGDLSDAVLNGVLVASDDDMVGIKVQLKRTAAGVYSNTVSFTTGQSDSAAMEIHVKDKSAVTVSYADAKPAGARTAKTLWKAAVGTVTLDAASYSSVVRPMVIMVNDTDVTDSCVLVTLNTSSSSATNLLTLKTTGTAGVFSGKVVFSIRTSNAETLLVKDKDVISVMYEDNAPAESYSAKAVWNGVAGVVSVDKAKYVAFGSPMAITLVDTDLTTPTVAVNVKSPTDTTGITATLKPVAGKIGTYSGSVTFTLNASVDGKSIQISDNDNVTVTYNDATPANAVTTKAVWNGIVGTVSLDDTIPYKGQAKATITVDDADVLDSTVTVKVKSEKDTLGITITLKGTAGKFTGKVGFSSFGASTATTLAAADSDTVTVVYNDLVPKTAVTKTTVYYMGLIPALGIYSNIATPGATVVTGLQPKLITWSGTVAVDSTTNHAGNANIVRFTSNPGSWAGAGWCQVADTSAATPVPAGINMSQFIAAGANCSLHVWMKGTAAIEILIEDLNPGVSGALQTWVSPTTYGYTADDTWHEVVIPLTAWTNCDFMSVSYLMGFRFVPFAAGTSVAFDDAYWTLPKQP